MYKASVLNSVEALSLTWPVLKGRLLLYNSGSNLCLLECGVLLGNAEHIENNKEKIEEKINNFQGETKAKMENLKNQFVLPFATKDEVVRDNLSYTITQNDVKPNNVPVGAVIYPLKYTKLPYKIYLINGGEEKEIEWLKKQDYKNLQARVWVVNGKLKELQDKLEVPIFFYSEKVHSRFKVKGTPSMINQDGEEMVFNYYKIER